MNTERYEIYAVKLIEKPRDVEQFGATNDNKRKLLNEVGVLHLAQVHLWRKLDEI